METNLTLPEQSEIPVHKCPRARIVDFLRGNLWMPFLVLGLAALASYFLLFKTENSNNLAETIINLTCAAAIFLGIQRNQPANKTAWYFILAGFTVFGLANIPTTYWIWSSGGTQPFPSIADAGYLSTGPLICIGLVLFIRNREHLKRNRGYIIDAAIFGVGAGFPIYTLLIAPNLFDPGVPLLSRLVSAAYPTADVLLIGVAIAFILGPGRRSLA
ncbi:MAG: hypothetical protein QOC87_2119, partial [Actinomycetota bacterium]|nr:hypothetical protein [Actinomycetota bacterium]